MNLFSGECKLCRCSSADNWREEDVWIWTHPSVLDLLWSIDKAYLYPFSPFFVVVFEGLKKLGNQQVSSIVLSVAYQHQICTVFFDVPIRKSVFDVKGTWADRIRKIFSSGTEYRSMCYIRCEKGSAGIDVGGGFVFILGSTKQLEHIIRWWRRQVKRARERKS